MTKNSTLKSDMHSFAVLFKVLFRNQNQLSKTKGRKANDGKKHLPQGVTMALSLTPLLIMLCAFLSFLTLQLNDTRSLAALMNVTVSAAQLMTLFIMMFGFTSTLYSADDSRLLSTLPIRPTTVFASKFALCYVNALAFSGALIIAPLLTITISYAAAGKALFYGVIPLTFLITLVAPVLPLLVVTLLSMPIVWIRSYLKARSTVSTILSLLFYTVIMAAYMVLVFQFSSHGGEIEMSSGALQGFQTISQIMYPNQVLILFCLGLDAGKNLGIFVALLVGAVALTILLAILFYKRITTKSIESLPEKHNGEVSFKRSGIVASLALRDFKAVMRTPTIAINSLATLVIGPIIIVAMYFGMFGSGNETGLSLSRLGSELTLMGIVVMYTFMMCGSSNMLSMMAFTREGKSFFIMKTLPLNVNDVIKAKMVVALVPIVLCLAVNMVICGTLLKADIMSVLLYGFISLIYCVGATAYNIYFDIKRGNVNWTSAAEMQMERKRDTATLLPVLSSMLPGVILFAPALLLVKYESVLTAYGVRGIYWAIALIFAIAECAFGFAMLIKKGVPAFPYIGENTVALKATMDTPKRGSGLFGGGSNGRMLG